MLNSLLGEPYFNPKNIPLEKEALTEFMEVVRKVASSIGFRSQDGDIFDYINKKSFEFENKILWQIYLKSDQIGSMLTLPFIKIERMEQVKLVLKSPENYLSDSDLTVLVFEVLKNNKKSRPSNLFKK